MPRKMIEELSIFDKGQLHAVNEIIGHIETDIAEIDAKKTPYLFRETAKDALYPYKLLVKRDLWCFILKQLERYKEIITKEEN